MKHRVLRGLSLVALVLILSCSTAFASKDSIPNTGPSVETCAELGQIEVTCYTCYYRYKLGTIMMESRYNALRDECIDRSKILKTCADELKHKGYNWRVISAKWHYTVGGETLKGDIDPCR